MDKSNQAFVIGPVGSLTMTFILILTITLLLFWYSNRNLDYWKKRGVPFVKPYPFFGSLPDIIRKPLHDTILERHNKYGRIYGVFEGNRPMLTVGDPELLRYILVKDFQYFTGRRDFRSGNKIMDSMISLLQGEDWKRVRSIITPTFTTGKIKKMIKIFKECAKTVAQNFQERARKGEPVDAKSLYGAFTMDVIASSAFSTKLDSHNDPNNKFVSTAKSVISRNISWRVVLFILFPGIMKFFKISVFPPSGMNFFKNVTLQIIEERKKTNQTKNDFLQLLMDTAKEMPEDAKLDTKEAENDIVENYGDDSDIVFKNIIAKKSLSRDELIAQCVIFFMAGYETTASTLSFASYLLAQNPDIQEKLIQEIDDTLTDNNNELTYEALQSMKYLDNVISETLRIYPPAIALERVADEEYKLGDTGITIPKGMVVGIPTYAMHRDPEYFPEPEKFKPDRFNPEERAKRNLYVFLPFGAGPRNCVAMRFALMEIKVCLAYVLSNFRFKKCSETKEPLDFYLGQMMLLPKSIMLQLEARSDAGKEL